MIAVLDIGGTLTRVGFSRIGVTLAGHHELPTPDGKRGLAQLAQEVRRLTKGRPLEAVVAGIPGTLDRQGRIYHCPNLPAWIGERPAAALAGLSAGPPLLANDAVLGGLGEAYVGAGTTKGSMAYVTVSTGVNGARLVNGRPDQAWGVELGSQLIGWNPPETLESVVGGHRVQERYGRLPSQVDDPRLWQTEVRALAAGVHNLVMHWRPELIVFGGSMVRDIPLDELEEELAKLPNPFAESPELRPAALGQLAGLHGGLALWRQQGS